MRSHPARPLHVYPKHYIYGKAFYALHHLRRAAACGRAPVGSAAGFPHESHFDCLSKEKAFIFLAPS